MLTQVFRVTRTWLNKARVVIPLMILTHLVGGLCFTIFEGKTFMDGQWWATVTGFTVGYGDFYPQTVTGKLAAMFYIWLMWLLGLIVGGLLVVTILEDRNVYTHEEQERVEAVLLEIGQHLGVIPNEARELPPLKWWQEQKGFIDNPNA